MKKSLNRTLAAASLAALSIVASPAQAAVNLVSNGSFEAPAITGSYLTVSGSDLTGWTIDSGNIDIVHAGPYVASDGVQAIDLVGTGVNTGSLFQTLSTTAGQLYRLTFDYTNNTDNSSALFTGNVSATGNSLLLGQNISYSGSTNGSGAFQHFDMLFTADSASTDLKFSDVSGIGNQGLFLDNVSVTAVPEAATWAMMLLGFGLVGFAMRKRTSVRTTIRYA